MGLKSFRLKLLPAESLCGEGVRYSNVTIGLIAAIRKAPFSLTLKSLCSNLVPRGTSEQELGASKNVVQRILSIRYEKRNVTHECDSWMPRILKWLVGRSFERTDGSGPPCCSVDYFQIAPHNLWDLDAAAQRCSFTTSCTRFIRLAHRLHDVSCTMVQPF